MANIGLKNFWYAKQGASEGLYDTPALLAGALEAKVSIEFRDGDLYYDDMLQDSVSEFKSGTITLTASDDDDTKFADLLGNTSTPLTTPETTTAVVQKVNDEPVYCGFGHIVTKRVDKVTKYKVEFFPKVKFKPFVTDSKTKGSSIDFSTPEVEGTIFPLADGTWEKHATFATEANALAYLKSLMPKTAV